MSKKVVKISSRIYLKNRYGITSCEFNLELAKRMYVNLHKDINNLTEDVTKAMKLLHASKCVPENIENGSNFLILEITYPVLMGKMHQDFIRDETKRERITLNGYTGILAKTSRPSLHLGK